MLKYSFFALIQALQERLFNFGFYFIKLVGMPYIVFYLYWSTMGTSDFGLIEIADWWLYGSRRTRAINLQLTFSYTFRINPKDVVSGSKRQYCGFFFEMKHLDNYT
jgi:hypothetical protein